MALPSTTVPLRKAVIAALTTETGKTGAIPATNLFRLARPSARAQRSSTVKGAPTAWVTVRDHAPDPDALLLEMSNVRRLVVVVEIECTYYAGSELFGAEHASALERIETDRVALIDALVFPEALRLDPDGQETGLDGGSLTFAGYRSVGPAPSPVSPESGRLLSVTHTFVCKVEIASRSVSS